MKILVGLRGSRLSRKQCEEVAAALFPFAPHVCFEQIPIQTIGDRDLEKSLQEMDKTDFFTRDIDQMQLEGKCRISIHSAKDLPDPLPVGLELIALTVGRDPSDSLVFRKGEGLATLRKGSLVGSSSLRRNQMVKKLRPDLSCVEVRGTIDARLDKLFKGEIDALVIAEAALIRLELTHLNRIFLPGMTAPLQGKLAVIAREGDREMKTLFAPIDSRRQAALYLGLDPVNFKTTSALIHCPVIQTVTRDFSSPEIQRAFRDIPDYTHLVFTSKMGVELFFACATHYGYTPRDIRGKEIIAVGTATATAVENRGAVVAHIAGEETQEGIIKILAAQNLSQAYLLLPCSSLARPHLGHFLMISCIRHQLCYLYDTKIRELEHRPDLNEVDEIIFTSPSTVDAFHKIFGPPPKGKTLTSIGPITRRRLTNIYSGGVFS